MGQNCATLGLEPYEFVGLLDPTEKLGEVPPVNCILCYMYAKGFRPAAVPPFVDNPMGMWWAGWKGNKDVYYACDEDSSSWPIVQAARRALREELV